MQTSPRRYLRLIADIIGFVLAFFIIQLVFLQLTYAFSVLAQGGGMAAFFHALATTGYTLTSKLLVVSIVLSSLFTLGLFVKLQWAPVSRNWLKTHPWSVVFWAVFLAIGTILPSEWLVEKLQYSLSEEQTKMFEAILSEPTGYLAVGLLVPLAEELVFRGAILRKLLGVCGERWHWVAIALSAVIFGAIHGNVPQFVHATLIGLLIGWMYYRTGSIIPGVVFHWVNNTVAYVMFNLMPQMADGKLIDLFHGDKHMMMLGLVFSLCILLPSILQLNLRMKRS